MLKPVLRSKRLFPAIFFVALVTILGAMVAVRTVLATPSSGLTSSPIAKGSLPEPIRAKFKDNTGGFGDGTDVSSIVMVKFVVEPGGSFGWHQHGGPVWAVIASGTLTLYDEDCQPEVYSAGRSLFESGNHTHNAFNEGSEPVEIYATFMLPEGGESRIDVPDPGSCSF